MSSKSHLAAVSFPPTDRDSGDVLTVKEAAALLRVNPKTLYEAIKRGQVPAIRMGRTIRLSRSTLLECLRGNGSPALGDLR